MPWKRFAVMALLVVAAIAVTACGWVSGVEFVTTHRGFVGRPLIIHPLILIGAQVGAAVALLALRYAGIFLFGGILFFLVSPYFAVPGLQVPTLQLWLCLLLLGIILDGVANRYYLDE